MRNGRALAFVACLISPGLAPALTATPTRTSGAAAPTETVTASPTSNRPPAIAKGRAEPNPAVAGEPVRLLDDGSWGGVAGRFWNQQGEPRVVLSSRTPPTFIAPEVSQPTTLTFLYDVCNYDSGCDRATVEVTIVPALSCIGDCDGDRAVTIAELLVAVNLALGHEALSSCPAVDAANDGTVAINDLVAAVERALNGCPAAPPPTAEASPSATPGAGEFGTCYESAACDPCDVYPCRPFSAERSFCCQLRGGGGTFSWCPSGQFDPETLECAQCGDPCSAPMPGAPTATPTPSVTPMATPTSCHAVVPRVAPITSPTGDGTQTIFLCGIATGAATVSACGPAGCIDGFTVRDEDCPITCDPRQRCVSGELPLLLKQVNAVQVCQAPGVGCGPLPDLCAEEDVNGVSLSIEHSQ